MPNQEHEGSPHPALRSIPGLSEEDIAMVWAEGRTVTVPAGWSMIHEFEPPDTTYFILDGRAVVSLHRESITSIGAGGFVGEIAPVAHRLRTATVTASEPLLTLAFPADVFAKLRKHLPRFDRAVVSLAESRVAELEHAGY